MVLTFEPVDEVLSVTVQMKAAEQYFHIVRCKVVLPFESMGKSLKCDHLDESCCLSTYYFLMVLFVFIFYLIGVGNYFSVKKLINDKFLLQVLS